MNELDVNKKYDMAAIQSIGIYNEGDIISAVYFEGEKGWTMIKRFMIETSTLDTKYKFITDATTSKLYFVSNHPNPHVILNYKIGKEKLTKQIALADFIDVKGWKAMGNKVLDGRLTNVELLNTNSENEVSDPNIIEKNAATNNTSIQGSLFDQVMDDSTPKSSKGQDKYKSGDTIEFDM
jgi:topoisomerase-4 subunit A